MLTPLWFPIHMRLFEQSRFKPCLWCIYFLLESKDLHAVGWLGWGFLSICDHLKSLKMGDNVRSIKKQIICCGLKSKGWVKISCFFVLHDKNIQTIIWDYYQNYKHQINFYFIEWANSGRLTGDVCVAWLTCFVLSRLTGLTRHYRTMTRWLRSPVAATIVPTTSQLDTSRPWSIRLRQVEPFQDCQRPVRLKILNTKE